MVGEGGNDMDKMFLKISIITVCYNSEKNIEQTIRSVLKQGYKNKEYIIIDGGSNDNTKEIIGRYQDKLAYWCSEPDQGLYDAMNKGIQHSTGDVIAFLNSDDWYENDVLDKVNEYFLETKADMISGRINAVINDRIFLGQTLPGPVEDIRIGMIYPHQALFAKAVIFKNIGGFNLRYKIAADYDWILRAYVKGANILRVKDTFTNCRDGGISSNAYECGIEHRTIALSYLCEYTKEIDRKKIENYYEDKVNEGLVMLVCQEVLKKNAKSIGLQIGNENGYYIWGTGRRGEKCYNMLKKMELKINGFIDNSRTFDVLHGYKVLMPEEVGEEGIICISTSQYEKEIIKQMQEMRISKERYISFYEIQRIVAKLGL